MSPRTRARIARWLIPVCFVAWIATQATVARGEPTFTLGLSWLALILTLFDLAATTDVRDQADRSEADEDGRSG